MEMRNTEVLALPNCHRCAYIVPGSSVLTCQEGRAEGIYIVRTISIRSIFRNRLKSEFSDLEQTPQNHYLN